jgi:sulfoxide reductase heme-binding subunit YedZ
LIPVGLLVYRFFTDDLGANPISEITLETGVWTLRFVAITLCATPLQKLFKLSSAGRFRRMLGLFAFFYGCLHFTTYIWLDQFFDVHSMLNDVVKRPFITVGFASFVAMIPLAVTSTNRMLKWLGGKKWSALHRLIYFTAVGGVVHYYWLVKADVRRPIYYACVMAALLGFRIVWKVLKNKKRPLPPIAVA